MQLSLFTLLSPGRVAALFFLMLSISAIKGQSPIGLTFTNLSNGDCKFTTSGLNNQDLVFYRFSDGFHIKRQYNSADPTSNSVTRRFRPAAYHSVTAYVARKGGPVLLTYLPFNPATNSTNPLPFVGLGANEFIRFGYTWEPFTNLSGTMALSDPTTVPAMANFPVQSWFMLPVTINPPKESQSAEINIPPGLTCLGVIYKRDWLSGQNQLTYPGGSEPISSITKTNNKVTVVFEKPGNGEFNLYVIVTGAPQGIGQHVMTGQVFGSQTPVPIGQCSIAVQVRQNPHDPNALTAYQKNLCPRQVGANPLRYRVEFQNIGSGPAEDVEVRVDLISNGGELSSPLVSNQISNVVVNPSWIQPVVSVTTVNPKWQQVHFFLDFIALPGLNQVPPPNSYSETTGWVEFDIQPNDCLDEFDGTLLAQGTVSFSAGTFHENVLTNETSQIVWPDSCLPDNPGCNQDPNGGGRSVGFGASAPTHPQYYPSPFNERLQMEVPVADANTPLTILISDITGKIWMEKSVPAGSGEVFRQSLDTQTWPVGMYLVHCMQGGHTSVGKILKQ